MQLMTSRVLLVEDDARLASMVVDYLGEAGFRVEVAPTGADAMRLVGADDFDVVILDIMLPGLNGFVVAERLRRAGRRVPILMLTAKNGEFDQAEAEFPGSQAKYEQEAEEMEHAWA